MIFTALKHFSFSSGCESSDTLCFPHLAKFLLPLTNHALASLQNIAQGSNSLWNHSRPSPPGTRHANYPRNPFIHAAPLVSLPFLITRHSLRTSILYGRIYVDSYAYVFTQTLFTEGRCWRLFKKMFFPLLAYAFHFLWNFPYCRALNRVEALLTVTNLAAVI